MATKLIPYEDIREGSEAPPRDEEEFFTLNSYIVYLNRDERTVTFFATDYHPGVLILTTSGLEKLLSELR